MKKLVFILLILLLKPGHSVGQEKNTKVLKLQPFSFITGSLNVQQEIFSKDMKKSTSILLGVRNVNNTTNNVDYNSGSSKALENTDKWKGVTIGIDRKIYVPAFQKITSQTLDKNRIGLYFSIGARIEYNENTFNRDYYTQNQDVLKPGVYTQVLNNYNGKINYLGIMPNLNLGLQFTVFQNLYCDITLGGGLKFISTKEKQVVGAPNSNIYYYDNLATNAIATFVIKEGVRPNFGFGLGLEI